MGIIGMLLDSPTCPVSFQVEQDGIIYITSPIFSDKMTQFVPGTPFNDQWRKEENGKTHVTCSIFLKDCKHRENPVNRVRLNVLADNLRVTGPIVWYFVYQKQDEGEEESHLVIFTTETNFSTIE